MAGLFDSLVISKTVEGNVGTAGRWPSGRKITGIIAHSPAEFHVKHTALGALANVTFVNYTNTPGSQFRGALEVCIQSSSLLSAQVANSLGYLALNA